MLFCCQLTLLSLQLRSTVLLLWRIPFNVSQKSLKNSQITVSLWKFTACASNTISYVYAHKKAIRVSPFYTCNTLNATCMMDNMHSTLLP